MVQNAGTKQRNGLDQNDSMPALPSNTYRTPYGYIFRVVVPESLRKLVGKREIKKSLGQDYQKAVSQARLLAVQVDRRFNELRKQVAEHESLQSGLENFLARPLDQRLKPLTVITPELVSALKSLWLSTLETDLTWRREGIDDDEYEDLQENIATMQRLIGQALARGKVDPFIPVARTLLLGRGYDLAVSAEEERKLVLDLLPAIQEGYDILEQRQNGRLVKPAELPTPPLPAVWEAASPDEGGLTWQSVFEHWRDDRPRPARTARDAETYLSALQEFLPRSTPATLTRAQVTDWLRHVRETRGNSAKTLEKKGTLVGAMFSVAVKDELLEKNPFAQFDYSRFALKEGIEPEDERDPFSLEQIKRIFSRDEGLFSPKISSRSGGGGYHARVWISLLSFLSGARLDEIGRLTPTDIELEPVPYFRIRRGKNQSSVRDVPLHPKLIELGFLDYVTAIRAAGHTSLWPNLKTRSDVFSNSEVLGKWFNRFIHETLKMPASVVFHSFRHTFKDMCRDALIPRDLHHALTGHMKSDDDRKNVGDDYGKGFSLETKFKQISRIEPGLNLPKPSPYEPKRRPSTSRGAPRRDTAIVPDPSGERVSD